MELIVKYHDKNMPRIEKIAKGNWIDLRAIEGGKVNGEKAVWQDNEQGGKVLRYKAGDFLMINLGITIAQPEGYEVYIAPRSSTFKNFGLIQTNSIGIGDDTFRGNSDIYHLPCFALRDGEINLYDRVCQFRLQEVMPELSIIEVQDTGYDNRSGFGSTGTK